MAPTSLAHYSNVLLYIKRGKVFNCVSFWFLQNRKEMNEMMKHMEENIEKVKREKKRILYAIVCLLYRKI
jgi:hypothetical protein